MLRLTCMFSLWWMNHYSEQSQSFLMQTIYRITPIWASVSTNPNIQAYSLSPTNTNSHMHPDTNLHVHMSMCKKETAHLKQSIQCTDPHAHYYLLLFCRNKLNKHTILCRQVFPLPILCALTNSWVVNNGIIWQIVKHRGQQVLRTSHWSRNIQFWWNAAFPMHNNVFWNRNVILLKA